MDACYSFLTRGQQSATPAGEVRIYSDSRAAKLSHYSNIDYAAA